MRTHVQRATLRCFAVIRLFATDSPPGTASHLPDTAGCSVSVSTGLSYTLTLVSAECGGAFANNV